MQQPQVNRLLVPESTLTNALSQVGTSEGSPIAFITAHDDQRVGESRLNPIALEFSRDRVQTLIAPRVKPNENKIAWQGILASDRTSRMFRTTWIVDGVTVTWLDSGVTAYINVAMTETLSLKDLATAEQQVRRLLEGQLALPPVDESGYRFNLKKIDSSGGVAVYAGTVIRGVETRPLKLSSGEMGEAVVGQLAWHNYIYVATDGQNLLVRLNFYDTDRDTIQRVANPLTRFKS